MKFKFPMGGNLGLGWLAIRLCSPGTETKSKAQSPKSKAGAVEGCWLKVESWWRSGRTSASQETPLRIIFHFIFPGHMTRGGDVVELGQIFDMGRSKKSGVRSQKSRFIGNPT